MTQSIERWLPVVGWEGLYEVSDLGRVKSLPRVGTSGVILKPSLRKDGYIQHGLTRNCNHVNRLLHHLVAEAFIGPRPAGCECCHNDGDPGNNALANIRWDTPLGNSADKTRHGTQAKGETSGMAKLTNSKVAAIRADPRTHREIAADYGLDYGCIGKIKRRERWAHIP